MVPKILCGWFVLLLIGLGCGMAQVTVPDTPAGHTLQAWLDAFNSGDRAKIETLCQDHRPLAVGRWDDLIPQPNRRI